MSKRAVGSISYCDFAAVGHSAQYEMLPETLPETERSLESMARR